MSRRPGEVVVVQQYVRAAGVETAPMKDEMVLFNSANNAFCVLNPTAAFIWERLANPQSVEALCLALAASYANVPDGAVEDDVSKTLQELQNASCVVPLAAA